jgi:hypothetical protein
MRASTLLSALTVTIVILAPFASLSFAQTTQTTPGTLQERQESCNAQASAKNLAGDPRKIFMTDCLGGGSGTSSETSQQMLMRSCTTTANSQNLTGDVRTSFMSKCMSGQ